MNESTTFYDFFGMYKLIYIKQQVIPYNFINYCSPEGATKQNTLSAL